MKKANPLMAGLEKFDRKTPPQPEARAAAPAPAPAPASAPLRKASRVGDRPSRVGEVQIAAFFPEDVRAQLKIIAAEQRRDMQDLIAEGLNLIFVKYGKAEIAPIKRAG